MITECWVSIARVAPFWKTFNTQFMFFWDSSCNVQILHIRFYAHPDMYLLTCWNGEDIFQFVDDGSQNIWSISEKDNS